MTRRYDYGRGSPAAWAFIACARGDRNFPDAASWRELEQYLVRVGAATELIVGAKSVWRSFTALRSRLRAEGCDHDPDRELAKLGIS